MRRNQKGQFIKGSSAETYNGFGIWYDAKGYPIIWIDGKSINLHVYIWECRHSNKPKGFVIHHKDLDKGNYAEDNLELLSKSDHHRVHAGWLRENGKWVKKPCSRCRKILPLDRFYPRKGYAPSALCRSCHNEVITKMNSTPIRKKTLKKYKHDWYEARKKEVQNA